MPSFPGINARPDVCGDDPWMAEIDSQIEDNRRLVAENVALQSLTSYGRLGHDVLTSLEAHNPNRTLATAKCSSSRLVNTGFVYRMTATASCGASQISEHA